MNADQLIHDHIRKIYVDSGYSVGDAVRIADDCLEHYKRTSFKKGQVMSDLIKRSKVIAKNFHKLPGGGK